MAEDQDNNNKNEEAAEAKPDKAEEQKKSDTQSDVDKNKALAIIAYIGILWIVPVVAAKDSEYAMFHANQGLNLFLVAVALMFIWIIPILGWLIGFFGWIFVVILAIMGIINAANGEQKPLPIIGGWRLIKQ